MNAKDVVRFRLYIAGESPNSLNAVSNLRAFCQAKALGEHEIEIIDLFLAPDEALEAGIFLTPTLAIISPDRTRKIVGDLSDATVLHSAIQQMGTG